MLQVPVMTDSCSYYTLFHIQHARAHAHTHIYTACVEAFVHHVHTSWPHYTQGAFHMINLQYIIASELQHLACRYGGAHFINYVLSNYNSKIYITTAISSEYVLFST